MWLVTSTFLEPHKTLKRFWENLNDACAIFSVNKIMNGIHSYPDQICLQRASFELRNAYLHAHCITIFNWSDKVHVESCNYFLDKTKIGKLTVFFMRSALANHRQGQWKELNNPRPLSRWRCKGVEGGKRGVCVKFFCIESALRKVPWRQPNFQGERQCLPLHIDGSPQYTLPLPPPTAA